MKNIIKIATLVITLIGISTTYAAIKADGLSPNGSGISKDYIGTIMAASYDGQSVKIMTLSDTKNNESGLPGLTLTIDDKDLPFGLTLASNVGKKLAVSFADYNYDIASVSIITDEYWNGHK